MKRLTAIILTVMMLCTANTVFARDYAQRFWDVPKDYWGFEYIADLAERGVIKGYEDGSFKPENIVLRSEWAKMMVTAAGLSVNDNGTYFTDTTGHWANSYINTAKNYLTGYSDGSYRPDQAATREDVTVAMVKLKGYDLSDVDYSYLNTFRDVDSISNYAKGYVAVAIKNNLISGFEDNTFRGQDTLTRAEAATLMYRAFKHGNADKVTTTPTTPITSDTSKSNEDYAKQAEPKYEEPKQETKKTETKSEEPKTEVTNDEPQEEEKAQPHYEVTTLAKLSEISKETGISVSDITDSIPYKNGIAFLANNSVISVDESGNIELLYDFNEQDTELFSEYKLTACGIGYDDTNDCILISCADSENGGESYLVGTAKMYVINDDECKLIDETTKTRFKGRFFVAGENLLIGNSGDGWITVNTESFQSSNCPTRFGVIDSYNVSDGLILVAPGYDGYRAVGRYDYSTNSVEEIISIIVNDIALYQDKYAVAVKGNEVALIDLKTCKYNKFEVKVKDQKAVDFSRCDVIKVLDKNGSFIFYDYSNKAYRYAEFVE